MPRIEALVLLAQDNLRFEHLLATLRGVASNNRLEIVDVVANRLSVLRATRADVSRHGDIHQSSLPVHLIGRGRHGIQVLLRDDRFHGRTRGKNNIVLSRQRDEIFHEVKPAIMGWTQRYNKYYLS